MAIKCSVVFEDDAEEECLEKTSVKCAELVSNAGGGFMMMVELATKVTLSNFPYNLSNSN